MTGEFKTDGSASQAQSNQTGVTHESAGESRVANAQLEPSLVNPPPRKFSIDDLEKMLDREPDAPLEILPNGEIREYSEEEKAKIRSERKPLTLRENLGGEYAQPIYRKPNLSLEMNAALDELEQARAEMRKYAGQSFSADPETAAEYILGSSQFDADLQRVLEDDGTVQNAIDPSLPPPPSATLEEIVEATKHVPRRPRLDALIYRPHQVMAIAASLVADFPGMFAGPDILSPLRVPLPPLVVADPPPLEKRPGHRSGYKVASEAHHVPTSRFHKPAGSKLARKAAKGKL